MNSKSNLSRITIDIPEKDHKRFKAFAAIKGKSMKELIVESIQKHLEEGEASDKKAKLKQ